MTVAARLGQLFRRDASLRSIGNVRDADAAREARLGATSAELNARFAHRVRAVETRVQALETKILGD